MLSAKLNKYKKIHSRGVWMLSLMSTNQHKIKSTSIIMLVKIVKLSASDTKVLE